MRVRIQSKSLQAGPNGETKVLVQYMSIDNSGSMSRSMAVSEAEQYPIGQTMDIVLTPVADPE